MKNKFSARASTCISLVQSAKRNFARALEILQEPSGFVSLTRLFNLSLETRTFPSLWKFGKVAALFKKGDRCDANNYRPITVLVSSSNFRDCVLNSAMKSV